MDDRLLKFENPFVSTDYQSRHGIISGMLLCTFFCIIFVNHKLSS